MASPPPVLGWPGMPGRLTLHPAGPAGKGHEPRAAPAFGGSGLETARGPLAALLQDAIGRCRNVRLDALQVAHDVELQGACLDLLAPAAAHVREMLLRCR